MLDRRAASWSGAVLTLALASGCAEPPSYTVRWQLRDGDEVFELTSVKQCADVGLSKVRVTTSRDDVVVDQRDYPCFPSAFEHDEGVEVSGLPPGEYAVDVEGLRRTGEPWICETPPCIAFAQDTVVVVEGELPGVEVELLQPPQCDDGIDNDRDGLVDGRDPACIVDPTGFESADAELTLFQLSVSFLDSSVVFPADVFVDVLRLEIDGQRADGTAVDVLLAEIPDYELDKSQWPFGLPLLAHDLEPGSYVLSAVGINDEAGDPVTVIQEVPFEVPLQNFVLEHFEFGGDQFLEPIEQPIAVALGLLLDPAAESGPACTLGGYLGGALVSVDRMWLRVTDESGQPLDTAILNLTNLANQALMPVDETDGWISLPCPSAPIKSSELSWGSYQLEVEARIGEVACFTSEGPRDLAPLGQGGPKDFLLTRIVNDRGAPPAGCEECEDNNDCSGQVCDAGICKDKLP